MPLIQNNTEYLFPQEAAEFLGLSLDQFKHRVYRLKLVPKSAERNRTPLFLASDLEANRARIVQGNRKPKPANKNMAK